MKNKVNLYCVLMLLALAFATTLPHLFAFSSGVVDGWKSSSEGGVTPQGVNGAVQLLPKENMFIFHDSIMNTKTGEKNGVQILEAFVNTPSANRDDYGLVNTTMAASGIIGLVLLVTFIVLFVKIILAVNRKEIFDVRMERRLSWLGYILMTYYSLSWLVVIVNLQHARQLFAFEHYHITVLDSPHVSYLLAGIGMLLIAQIFGTARRMKEDQELTI